MVTARAGAKPYRRATGSLVNPLGLLVLALGVVIIIVGVKGSQHNLVAALTNKAQPGQAASKPTPAKTTATAPPKVTLA